MTDIELALVEYDGNGKHPYCDLVCKGLKILQSLYPQGNQMIIASDLYSQLIRKAVTLDSLYEDIKYIYKT